MCGPGCGGQTAAGVVVPISVRGRRTRSGMCAACWSVEQVSAESEVCRASGYETREHRKDGGKDCPLGRFTHARPGVTVWRGLAWLGVPWWVRRGLRRAGKDVSGLPRCGCVAGLKRVWVGARRWARVWCRQDREGIVAGF